MSKLGENEGLLKRQKDSFELLFIEYQKFVNENMRFPTAIQDGISSKGTKLSSWRANTMKIDGFKERLIEFDKSMIPIFTKLKELQKEQKLFDKLIGERWLNFPNRPRTITEYLEGDNRYKYFDLSVYFKIMKHLNMNNRIDNITSLMRDIYRVKDMEWKTYHHWFVDNIEQVVLEVLDELSRDGCHPIPSKYVSYERNVHILKLYYGLYEGCQPMTLQEVGETIDRSRERVRGIIAKCLRLLRHPSRSKRFFKERVKNSPGKKNYPKPNEHMFVITSSDYGTNSIQLPMEDVEKALESFGYKTYGSNANHYIKSVNTYSLYEENINEYVLAALNLCPSLDMRLITYTEISLEPIIPFDVKEHLRDEKEIIDQAKKEKRRRLEIEKAERQRKEKIEKDRIESQKYYDDYFKSQHQREEWNNVFSAKILSIINSIILDNSGNWIPIFNRLMDNYPIPEEYQPMVCKTLEYYLRQKIQGFRITIKFINHEKFGSIMNLTWLKIY